MTVERKPITILEAMIVLIIALFIGGWVVEQVMGIESVPILKITYTEDEPTPEVPRITLSAILSDEKGRTVPVEVLVAEEDLPKLVQGHRWGMLIDTDDPRWNLEE